MLTSEKHEALITLFGPALAAQLLAVLDIAPPNAATKQWHTRVKAAPDLSPPLAAALAELRRVLGDDALLTLLEQIASQQRAARAQIKGRPRTRIGQALDADPVLTIDPTKGAA
jgi:hypothetical protein